MKAVLIAAIVSAVVAATTATAGTMALITGKQIKNGSIGLADLSPAAKRALRGQRGLRGLPGARGPAGTAGAQGAQGAPGAAGGFDPAKLQYIPGATVTVAAFTTGGAQANCPPGTVAISGGFSATEGHVAFSETLAPTHHAIQVNNDTGSSIQIRATVVCSAR